MIAGKRWAKEKAKSIIKQGPALNRASHKGQGNQKIVKNRQQTVQANYGRRISSR